MSMKADVVVVGGGVIGGSIALALVQRGVSVTLIESGRIGRQSSWAAAGVLHPDESGKNTPELASLCDASLAQWPEWSQAIEARTGVSVQYRQDGLLDLWVEPDAPNLPDDLATEPSPEGGGQTLSADEARRLEPILTGPIAGGVLYPRDCQVDNPRLAPALARAASDLGATVLTGMPVASLIGSAGVCKGVRTLSGREISAGAVVLAAGAWSGPLAAMSGIALPTEPWRGQVLAFDCPARPLSRIVFCGELVLVPRPHGVLLVGTTMEKVGFDPRVTMAGLRQILNRAERIVPGLGDLPLLRTWAGLRPGTPDGLPYLGAVLGWDGLYAATGHGRKGLILAPITGDLIASLILTGQLDPRLTPFLPERHGQPLSS